MTRWDRDVPERWGASVERTEPLERRARRWGNEPRGRLPATLLVVRDTCWSCRAPVRAIVGVLVDPGLTEDRSGFLALADVDRILMAVVDPVRWPSSGSARCATAAARVCRAATSPTAARSATR